MGVVDLPHYVGHRERLRDRFVAGGPDALPDYELLELLLFMAIPRKDIKALAKALHKHFHENFGDVIAAPVDELKKFGLSDNAVAAVKVVEAAALRLARVKVLDRPALSSWEAVLDYCSATM